MAKISGEMIQKYNGQMKNGWQFDIDHFIYPREKGAALRVNLDEKHFLAASLYYSDQYDHATRKTRQHIHLHISFYTRERDTKMAVSHGMGRFFKLGEYERKNFAEIIKKTADFDAAKIRALYERNRAALETPYANGGGVLDEMKNAFQEI